MRTRLNRKRNEFTVQFRKRDLLTVIAVLSRDVKLKRLLDSATAAKALNGVGDAGLNRGASRDRTRFRTSDSLTAVPT